ncbi:MAG TPA: GNAT family N-acetyltransferase [candidate division Zixibacteria bacterium]|nr:GNAT family N-acetyltransferase [candidate division Zixibacteria bacterium]
MSVEIEKVETKKQLKQFISVPWDVYKNEPNWVPWLFFERMQFFDKQRNPFFEHAEADYFIARRDGKAVGSIAAVLNHRHNEIHEENIAHFGVFELQNDPEVAAALLETACKWARDMGTDRILGPANLSSTMEWGMLFDGYDSPPVVLMPYNPPYYNDFVEAAGFTKAMDLYAWNNRIAKLMEPGGLPEKLVRVVGKVKDRYKLNIRALNMKDFDNEIKIVKHVYNSAWEKNWGFVPLTDNEFDSLVTELKPILDPRIVFIVEAKGEPVGFSLSFPDVNQVLHKLRPGPTTIGSYIAGARMLRNKTKTNRLRVFALGVLEEYRARGVDALMYYETVVAGVPLGYEWAEGSWVLENNDAANRVSEMVGSDLYKRYRVYEKVL